MRMPPQHPLFSAQEHIGHNLAETQERSARMLEQHRRHLADWRAESERHVRALIEHQRGIEARLAEAGEYLRIREEEVRALTDETKQLKQLLVQV